MNNGKFIITWVDYLLISGLLLLTFPITVHSAPQEKHPIGWIENIQLSKDFVIPAKIDTGARHSSINSPDYKLITKNDEQWVNFTLANGKGNKFNVEKKIIRHTRIKRKGQEAKQRPVILLGICVANVYKEAEVNLANRQNFNYQVLIGRSFLTGNFTVDPELKHTTKPACNQTM